ncbi:hypothetical protein [Herbidospora sp. RD11066]
MLGAFIVGLAGVVAAVSAFFQWKTDSGDSTSPKDAWSFAVHLWNRLYADFDHAALAADHFLKRFRIELHPLLAFSAAVVLIGLFAAVGVTLGKNRRGWPAFLYLAIAANTAFIWIASVTVAVPLLVTFTASSVLAFGAGCLLTRKAGKRRKADR